MNTMVTLLAAEELRERHGRLLRSGMATSLRDGAARLGVTEVELVAAQCGLRSVELALKPARLLPLLATLGEVRVVTGSHGCVQESTGRYAPVDVRGNVACVQGGELDLRLFLSHWGSCHAVSERGEDSLRCYDRGGRLMHAIHLTAASCRDSYETLLRQHARKRWQMPCVEPLRAPLAAVVRDQEALRRQWLALSDAGEFGGLLQRLRVPRLSALQAASPELAQEVGVCAIMHALKIAAATQLPVRSRVCNRGAVQTRAGVLTRAGRTGRWLGAQDARHVLEMDAAAIDSVWVVALPSASGWRLDLEAYAGNGDLVVQLGSEGRGAADPGTWQQLLRGLCDEPLAV